MFLNRERGMMLRRLLLLVTVACAVALSALTVWTLAAGPANAQTPEERGVKLYAEDCAACHGARGEGRVGARLKKDFPAIEVDEFLRQVIANGVQGSVMPAWGQANGGPYTDEQLDAIIAFIGTWQTGATPIPTAPRPTLAPIPTIAGVVGDPTNGGRIFAENCAMCHGKRGEGRVGAGLAKALASANVDQYLRQTIGSGVSGATMPAWLQANGGPLSDEELDDVVAFVRTLQIRVTPTPVPELIGQISVPGYVWLLILLGVILIAGLISILGRSSR